MIEPQEKQRDELERIRFGQVGEWRYACVMKSAQARATTVPYVQRPGAAIWVFLGGGDAAELQCKKLIALVQQGFADFA